MLEAQPQPPRPGLPEHPRPYGPGGPSATGQAQRVPGPECGSRLGTSPRAAEERWRGWTQRKGFVRELSLPARHSVAPREDRAPSAAGRSSAGFWSAHHARLLARISHPNRQQGQQQEPGVLFLGKERAAEVLSPALRGDRRACGAVPTRVRARTKHQWQAFARAPPPACRDIPATAELPRQQQNPAARPRGCCGGAEHPLPAPAPARGTDPGRGSPPSPPRQGGGASTQDGVVYRGQLYLQEQLLGGQRGCGPLAICAGIAGECKHRRGNGTGTSLPPALPGVAAGTQGGLGPRGGGLGTLRGPAVLPPLAIAAARGLIRRQRCSAWPGRASEPRCPFTPPGEVCPPRVYFLPRDGQDLPHACTPGGAPRTQGDQKGRIARGLWDEFSKSHGGVLPRWRSRRFTNAPPLGRQGGICASGSGPNRGCWGGALPHGSPRSRFRRQRGDNVRHMRMMKGFAARGENR